MTGAWLVVLFLISVNALYVLAEFAAVSVRRTQVRRLAEQGNRLAAMLLSVVEDRRALDTYVAACQIGITWSSLVLGAYGQATLAPRVAPLFESWGGLQQAAAHSTSAVVVLVGLTALQVVLGELVPKSAALQHPTPSALYTALPMRWSLAAYAWFIRLLNGSAWAVLRLLGMASTGHRHIHSPDEIELLIAQSRDAGLLEPDEHDRLRRALRLARRPVRQLMVPRPQMVALDLTAPADELVDRVLTAPYTRLPAYEGSIDRVVGVLHTKDFALCWLDGADAASVRASLRPPLFVPESMTADRVLARLREGRSHMAIVLDEFGGVAGLVTVEDVLGEVLGEVGDEFHAPEPAPEPMPDGRVRLPGRMPLDEAEAWLGTRWEGESETVGGLVVETLGRVPVAGERVNVRGVDVEVERVAGHAVLSVLATPLRPDGGGEDG
ncbi:MAG: hemolysin family protein [Armatimonadota bacterium]|nr:hemolysin family protein [Armatimonadota bacterium]MDR5696448.1 hemolysin family protein [Armatimonadota bacterium]